jgi:hypothetical protein
VVGPNCSARWSSRARHAGSSCMCHVAHSVTSSRMVPRGSVPVRNTRLTFARARIRYRVHYGARRRRRFIHRRPETALPSNQAPRPRPVPAPAHRRSARRPSVWALSASDSALLHLAPPRSRAQGRHTGFPDLSSGKLAAGAIRKFERWLDQHSEFFALARGAAVPSAYTSDVDRRGV